VAGGTDAVPDAALTNVRRPVRVAGSTRWTTAAELADYFLPRLAARPDDVRRVVVASGDDDHLADALAGGSMGALTLLTSRRSVDPATTGYLTEHRLEIGRLVVLGGESAITGDTLGSINGAVNGWPASG